MDTFPFTRYGTLDAVITDVSDDAVQDENLGWVYTTRAALQSQVINVEGREVRLSPGMTVMLELKTNRRRIIDYFLSPVMRYGMRVSGSVERLRWSGCILSIYATRLI